MRGAWIFDQGGPDLATAFRVTRRLHEEWTPYQHLEVYENPTFGRMLVLDGAVQTTELEEFVYHEMLVHPALLTHPSPRRVLIIGGGDGGALEEALKHPLERAVMVEIDEAVVRASRAYLSTICQDAFDDPRAQLVIGDGIAFVAGGGDSFDVVLVDSTDPQGPSLGLYSPDFYKQVAARLAPEGVLAVQSGSPLYQRDLLAAVRRHLRAVFPHVRTCLATVVAYPGGLWSFTLASRGRDPAALSAEEIARRTQDLGLRYYGPLVHGGAFHLPPYLRDQLGEG